MFGQEGVHAYVFIGRGWWGFSHDPAGVDLPAQHGPWSFFRNALIVGDGADASERRVLAGLTAQGWAVERHSE